MCQIYDKMTDPSASETNDSYVRFLHTVPSVLPVDIYANGELLKKNLRYGQYSDYYKLEPGNVDFSVYTVNTSNPDEPYDLIGILNITLPPKSVFTIAGIGVPGKLGILQIPETAPPIPSSKMSFLRFVNLSSDVPMQDVSLQDNSVIFQNVGFKDQTIYHRMEPGNYTLQFKSSASGLKMFEDLPIKLAPGALYTVYTIGYNTDDSKRKAILVQDGV